MVGPGRCRRATQAAFVAACVALIGGCGRLGYTPLRVDTKDGEASTLDGGADATTGPIIDPVPAGPACQVHAGAQFCNGFEAGDMDWADPSDLDDTDDSTDTGTVSTIDDNVASGMHAGLFAASAQNEAAWRGVALDYGNGDLYVRAYMKLQDFDFSQAITLFTLWNNIGELDVSVDNVGKLIFYGDPHVSGEAELMAQASDEFSLLPSKWHCVEWHISLDDNASFVELGLDGVWTQRFAGDIKSNYTAVTIGVTTLDDDKPDAMASSIYDDVVIDDEPIGCD